MVGICAGEFCQQSDIRERWPRQAAAHRVRATRRTRGTRARDYISRATFSRERMSASVTLPRPLTIQPACFHACRC